MLASSPEIDSISFADFSHCARYIVLYHYCVNFKVFMDKKTLRNYLYEYCHLYIFFSDVSDFFLPPFKKRFTCFLYVEFQELFVYLVYKYFIRYMFYKYFFLVSGLSFQYHKCFHTNTHIQNIFNFN